MCCLLFFRNLIKAQDSVVRTENEIKDTEKETNDLKAELKAIEDKAEEVIKKTNAAEVRSSTALQDRSHLKQLKCCVS